MAEGVSACASRPAGTQVGRASRPRPAQTWAEVRGNRGEGAPRGRPRPRPFDPPRRGGGGGVAKLPTCWRREGALGNRPPPSPGLPGKMPGTEEAPREVGIFLCCSEAKERVLGSSAGRQPEGRASCRHRERACVGMRLGGGVGAQLCSPLLRQSPLPRLFSLPPALSGMRRSAGVRAEWDARQVERAEESRPQGLVQCAAGRVGFGQILVREPARCPFIPVLGAPGLESRSLALQLFWKSLESCPLNGTLWAPPTPLSFRKAS